MLTRVMSNVGELVAGNMYLLVCGIIPQIVHGRGGAIASALKNGNLQSGKWNAGSLLVYAGQMHVTAMPQDGRAGTCRRISHVFVADTNEFVHFVAGWIDPIECVIEIK